MAMKAILFVPQNFSKIIDETGIRLNDTDQRRRTRPAKYGDWYFINDYVASDGEPTGTWVIMHESYMISNFTYDTKKIRTHFTTVTRD